MNCIIIADDLSGACDSALQFRKHGARTLVHVGWNAPPRERAEVEAFSTDSRDLKPCEADRRIRELAKHLSGCATLIFKKIDSLLRGNPGREIRTALDAFGCEVAIVTPGFPEMGRTVVGGYLHVHGDNEWKPVHVLELLRGQGLDECHDAQCICVDCASSEDLRTVVAEAMRTGQKILWAGSAGLAGALADALFSETPRRTPRPRGTRPILFCIGSEHPVTLAQLETVSRERATWTFSASAISRAGIAGALAFGKHIIIRIDTGETETRRIRDLISWVAGLIEAVVISGGDTAALFCRATECETIEIEDQILDGVPWGTLRGGPVDGLAVATKSGAFGAPDALTKVTDFFTCRKN